VAQEDLLVHRARDNDRRGGRVTRSQHCCGRLWVCGRSVLCDAPGGTFSSAQLGCQSCHDPHGQVRRLSDGTYGRGATLGTATAPIIGSGSYNNSADPAAGQAVGAYRLLRGLNDTSVPGVTFTGVAIAVAPSTYNQSEANTQVRVSYGASGTNTWGNWCASCHPNMHSTGGNYVHPG